MSTLLVAAVVVALGLSGCSENESSDDGRIRVVASTSVYGDIVSTIGGSRVEVTSIISDPSQDPHSFEADARVQLALSKADVIVENGGGYDDFMGILLAGTDNRTAHVLNAVDISGFNQNLAGGGFNEHVWYDFPTVQKVADRVVTVLSGIDPASATVFTANAAGFSAGLTELLKQQADIKAKYAGVGVAITEPVPLYLLQGAGLVDKTPEKFSEAVENGTDVSPTVLRQTLELFDSGEVRVLAYNSQTSGVQSDRVLSAAKAAGVAAVPMAETLPPGKDYIAWMSDNLAAISAALH